MPTFPWKNARAARPVGRSTTFLLLVLLLTAVLPAGAQTDKSQSDKGQAAAPARDAPKDWQVILGLHQEALVQQASRFKSMESLLPKNVRRFRSDLAVQEGKLDELGLIISLSGGNPRELRAVLNDIQQIQRSTEGLVAPLQESRDELQKIASRLEALKEEFVKRLDESPEPEIAAAINYFVRYVSGVKSSLSGERTTLDKELTPAKDFLETLGKTRDSLRKKIPEAWKTYYLTSSPELFSWKAWSEIEQRLQLWARSNGSMLRSLTTGADAQRAMSVLVKVGVGLIFLAIFDFVAWRRLRRRAPQLRGRVLVRQAWLVAGLGLILHWVALDAPLLLHECCNGLAEILLAAALALFSWFLARISGLIDDDTAANPLRRLWLLYALGVALQIVDIPDPALTGCWMALLLVFFRIFRQRVGCDPGPLRLAGRVTPVLTVGLVLLSAVGWQHLSVLVLAGWFLLLAAVQIGVGLSRLVAEWQTRADREGTSLLTRSVVSGLGFPVIFLSLFFLVLYWFSIELGGQDLFVEAVAFTVTIGNVSVTLGRLALILTGFFLTRSAIDVARSFLRNLPRLRPEIDPGVCDVLDTTSMYLLWGCYALISLFLLGFSLTSLAVVAGGLSVGIGFGLQNIVNNFVAGLILLFGRSIQAGDTLQIDSVWGQVRKVNIRNTMIQTFDNATLFMPNSDLIAGKIINWSHRDPTVRREIAVGVAYGSDIEQVRSILLAAASAHPRVLGQPAPFVQFQEFGESSLDFKLFFWVDDVLVGMSVMSDIRFALDRLFRAAGISIPFPQREVRLLKDPEPDSPASGHGTD